MTKEILVIKDADYKRLKGIWYGIKQRCKPIIGNENYGLRGIRICEEWNKSFNTFVVWAIENNYHHYNSIDRIDVNGNYEPSNCRWSTLSEQAQNKRPKQDWNTKYKKLYGMHSWEIADKIGKKQVYVYSKHKRGELFDILKEMNLL